MALYTRPHKKQNNNNNKNDDVSYLCGEKIFTINNGLSKQECNFWICKAEKKGFNKSSISGGGHGRTGREDPRTSEFVVFPNEECIANILYNRIKKYIPNDLQHLSKSGYITSTLNASKWKAIGVSPYIRIYKYNVNQSFAEHIDYKMCRKVYKNGDLYQQMTFMSIIIYLNDNFVGGNTGFWTKHDVIGKKEHCRFLRGIEYKPHDIVIKPIQGKICIMDQNMLHEGLPPTKGIKYLLRTDIIHQKFIPKHEKLKKYDNNKYKQLNKVCEWEKLFETSCKNYAD